MLVFVPSRQCYVLVGSLLGFLNETVQQHHATVFVDIEKHPRDPVLCKVCPDFVDTLA
jgi:hypothetical protein